MRHANVEKAGYFPLPESLTSIIASYIATPHGGRIYDPCAGEGAALADLARMLHLEPYGVELHRSRAVKAMQTVATAVPADTQEAIPAAKRIIHQSYLGVITQAEAFTLIYCNPPYMLADEFDPAQKEFGRDEYRWLKETRKYLQPGGVFIWVVPQHMLLHKNSLSYLTAWFDQVRAYRFPDGEYERFRQVVVFGRLRPHRQMPDAERMEQLREGGRIGQALQTLEMAAEPRYTLPPPAVPPAQMVFRNVIVEPEEAIADAARHGVATTEAFAVHLTAHTHQSHRLTPLTPMKKGHMVSIIAAGLLNGALLEDASERLLIKGQSYKTIVVSEKTERHDEGHTTHTLRTEKVVTRITALHQTGEIQELTGPALELFLNRWLDRLTQKVVEDYPPLYRFDLNGCGRILKHLNPHRNIPRVGKPGLLPAQAHAAAAAALRLQRADDAYIIGEMGTGKTVMGTAVAAILHAQSGGKRMNHILILCPPHLVAKWEREVQHVWPAAKTKILKTIRDVDGFFATPGPIFGIMKETTGRIATGWNHALNACGPATFKQRSPKQKVTAVHHPRLKAGQVKTEKPLLWQSLDNINQHRQARRRPQFGRLPATMQRLNGRLTGEGLTSYRLRRGLRCPHCGDLAQDNGALLTAEEFKQKQITCATCGRALYQMERRDGRQAHTGGSFAAYARREKSIRKGEDLPPAENIGYARWPLASYINDHYKGRLDLLIADEMHQFKGADSDRGYAYHRLCCAAAKVLGLTGTLYGGKASTLFYLLYRSSALIRRHFTKTEESGQRRLNATKWIAHYGILQEIETTHTDAHGKTSGNSKATIRTKELPGGSPAMLPWILESCVFVSLPDMGFALPDYEEIPVVVPMAPAQEQQYKQFEKTLRDELAKRLQVKDKSLLGAYITSLLTLPDSPWRNKGVATRNGNVVAFAPALPGHTLYPKEEAIIELIQEKVEQGEKVLLLCQQTNTLDITPYWVSKLKERNLQAAVLTADPDRREAWIEKQIKEGIDVLITHPKKVETGLDLLQFPTIIWMGTEYSLYTIQQASRRSWRIGQGKDVQVYFFVYAGTMQERALGLIAAKVGAAARVNGDIVSDEGLSEFDDYAHTDLVGALTDMLEREIQAEAAEEAMKQVNDAYELALKGNRDAYAHTPYSFAGCQSEEAVKQRYRQLCKLYHPDLERQRAALNQEKPKVENLADLFRQANRAFHEGEELMGAFNGPLLPTDETVGESGDDVDAVIRRLILGDKPQTKASKQPQPAARPADEAQFTYLFGIGRIPVEEKGNYRLTFDKGYVPVDEYEQMLAGTAVPLNGHGDTAVCRQPGKLETHSSETDAGTLTVDANTYQQMKAAIQTGRKIDTIFTVNGKKVIIAGRVLTPDNVVNGTIKPLTAYQIDLDGDHLDLLFDEPTRADRQRLGPRHGEAVTYKGFKYVLVGPVLTLVPEGYEMPKPEAKAAPTPRPEPVTVETTRPSRLVFGVHNQRGQVRDNGLDMLAVQQLSLFGT